MSVSAVGPTANDIRMDYMKLLVTQLQNQNPLEPLDNNEMAMQLAQLSELEQLENMNGTFREVLAAQQQIQATELIGKEVAFVPDGGDSALVGRVEAVHVYDEGIQLSVGNYVVDLSQVQSIRN
jgi:flagellar basal-body rod modification protein FlgD